MLETVASVALLCLSDARAFAQCAPANPGAGGTVTCSGTDNDGFTAPVNTPVTINVQGGASVGGSGIDVSGTGDSFVNNDGSIGGAPSSVVFNGVAGFSKTLTNNGTLNAGIVGFGDGIIVINQNGALNSGGITITGNGENTLNISAGRNVNGLVNITGAENFVDNSGTFNSGLTMTGTVSNSVIIRAGGQVNAFSLSGPDNSIDNSGTFNSNITLTGDGVSSIINRRTGVMQAVTSSGSAEDFFDNLGRTNGSILLGDGDDFLINRTLAQAGLRDIISNIIDMGAGDDEFIMAGGTVNGNVLLGSGEDESFITGGEITNTVQAQSGNDHVVWSGGTIIGLDMGTETDFAHFINLTPTNLKTGLPVNGGLGSDDRLLWTNTVGDGVARYIHWERFELTDNSELTFNNFAARPIGYGKQRRYDRSHEQQFERHGQVRGARQLCRPGRQAQHPDLSRIRRLAFRPTGHRWRAGKRLDKPLRDQCEWTWRPYGRQRYPCGRCHQWRHHDRGRVYARQSRCRRHFRISAFPRRRDA